MDSDDLDRAKLAVEEYKVLHAELLQRNSILVQMCGACIAAIMTVIGFTAAGSIPLRAAVFMVLLVIVFLLAIFQVIDSDARKACERIGEIEEYVKQGRRRRRS